MYDIEKNTSVKSVSEAVRVLCADPAAVIIAGGSDVLIKIRSGKLAGCRLVSIREIPELHGIGLEDDETICIRPLSTFTEISENSIIRERIPVLAWAVDQVGGPQIRNIGTIGGNISNGVTSADSASTLCALNAEIEITGPAKNSDGTLKTDGSLSVRRVPILEYYVKAGKVCLEPGEICTGIRIYKKDYDGYCGYYFKYGKRNAMEIATLGCSVVAKINGTLLEDVRIAFGVAGPVPMRCPGTEKAIRGKNIDDNLFRILEKEILTEIHPRDSWRASKAFRLQLAKEMPVRSLKALVEISAAGLKAGSNAKVGLL
ncbi:MAG: xanthine dehydrogenase FAD-binding subunit XdhB [Treponema sp.]|jgi:xanthine dehydrogenase FAD-binding subunit|nr:xanthine dehydrogenase FAD-binding subunit XdhB [Treponema sp.]